MKVLKFKIFLCIILIVSLNVPTAQSIYTAYTNKKTYVYEKASISSKKISISKNTKIYVVGNSKDFFKVWNNKKTQKGYILKTNVSKIKTSNITWKSKVEKLNWAVGKNVLRRNEYAYIYDVTNGIKVKIKRLGGTNHMDLEPATSSETQKLKKICGRTYSWKTYPVILQTNGRYIACSINIQPHGSQSLKNNGFKGHFCLHMVNSKTHGTDLVNEEHQKTIEVAYQWAQRQ